MDWRDLAAELEAQADTLSALLSVPEDQPRKRLARHIVLHEGEPGQRRLIDQVCQRYAEVGKWPRNLSNLQIALIYVRIAHATLFAEFLARNGRKLFGAQQLDQCKSSALEFLLVDVWGFWGLLQWNRPPPDDES